MHVNKEDQLEQYGEFSITSLLVFSYFLKIYRMQYQGNNKYKILSRNNRKPSGINTLSGLVNFIQFFFLYYIYISQKILVYFPRSRPSIVPPVDFLHKLTLSLFDYPTILKNTLERSKDRPYILLHTFYYVYVK